MVSVDKKYLNENEVSELLNIDSDICSIVQKMTVIQKLFPIVTKHQILSFIYMFLASTFTLLVLILLPLPKISHSTSNVSQKVKDPITGKIERKYTL